MATFKYRAFLSYSHRDAVWARWLHRALESYRIDKDLVGRKTAHGLVPKTLRPIFRDREDFSAGHSLTDQTLAALEASQFLVVICSPNSAQSQYVNEEILRFKSLGRASCIIPVIVGGEPGNPQRECFPPAVRFKLGADGVLTSEREEPIAADARADGDGREIAKQKVIAGLLGLGLDEIMRRAERARKRRNRIRMGAASAMVFLVSAILFAWTGMDTFHGRLRVQEDLNSARDAADICEGAAALIAPYQIPDERRISLALECVQTFSEVLADYPKGTELPQRVVSAFELNLAVLRKFRVEQKLSTEQIGLLDGAEILAAKLDLR